MPLATTSKSFLQVSCPLVLSKGPESDFLSPYQSRALQKEEVTGGAGSASRKSAWAGYLRGSQHLRKAEFETGMSGDHGDSGRSWECSSESALVPSVVARTHCSPEASPRPWPKEAPTCRVQRGEGGFSLQAVKGAAHPLGLTPGSLSFPKGHRRAGQVRCRGCSLRAQGGVQGLGRQRRIWDQKENIIVRNYRN